MLRNDPRILAFYQAISVVIDANTIPQIPNPATTKLPILRPGGIVGSNLAWINGGKTKAIGHPSKLPINETTLSRLSIVDRATSANTHTKNEEMTFRCCKHVAPKHDFCIIEEIDRHAISSDGKFWSGKVKMTAMLYANWTVVAKPPEGNDVVITVLTSSPKDIQQVIPKNA